MLLEVLQQSLCLILLHQWTDFSVFIDQETQSLTRLSYLINGNNLCTITISRQLLWPLDIGLVFIIEDLIYCVIQIRYFRYSVTMKQKNVGS